MRATFNNFESEEEKCLRLFVVVYEHLVVMDMRTNFHLHVGHC